MNKFYLFLEAGAKGGETYEYVYNDDDGDYDYDDDNKYDVESRPLCDLGCWRGEVHCDEDAPRMPAGDQVANEDYNRNLILRIMIRMVTMECRFEDLK